MMRSVATPLQMASAIANAIRTVSRASHPASIQLAHWPATNCMPAARPRRPLSMSLCAPQIGAGAQQRAGQPEKNISRLAPATGSAAKKAGAAGESHARLSSPAQR
eukprot:3648889-Alexandrium_andersonii.AAC.1